MKRFCLLFALLGFLPLAHAKDKATTLNREFTVKSVLVEMKNINDLGLVFVSREDGSLVLAGQAAWGLSLTGLAGKAEIELEDFIKDGENVVLFVLWNKPGKKIDTEYYKRSFMEKWSYEISLYGDGTNLFHQLDDGTSSPGVAYHFAFNVDKHGSSYEVSGANSGQLSRIAGILSKVNNALQSKSIPDNNTDIASMVSVALAGGS